MKSKTALPRMFAARSTRGITYFVEVADGPGPPRRLVCGIGREGRAKAKALLDELAAQGKGPPGSGEHGGQDGPKAS